MPGSTAQRARGAFAAAFEELTERGVCCGAEITTDMLANFVDGFSASVAEETPIVFWDITPRGAHREGLLITDSGMYARFRSVLADRYLPGDYEITDEVRLEKVKSCTVAYRYLCVNGLRFFAPRATRRGIVLTTRPRDPGGVLPIIAGILEKLKQRPHEAAGTEIDEPSPAVRFSDDNWPGLAESDKFYILLSQHSEIGDKLDRTHQKQVVANFFKTHLVATRFTYAIADMASSPDMARRLGLVLFPSVSIMRGAQVVRDIPGSPNSIAIMQVLVELLERGLSASDAEVKQDQQAVERTRRRAAADYNFDKWLVATGMVILVGIAMFFMRSCSAA